LGASLDNSSIHGDHGSVLPHLTSICGGTSRIPVPDDRRLDCAEDFDLLFLHASVDNVCLNDAVIDRESALQNLRLEYGCVRVSEVTVQGSLLAATTTATACSTPAPLGLEKSSSSTSWLGLAAAQLGSVQLASQSRACFCGS
jgi:hypothetical protein